MLRKSVDWFLYDNVLRHERVKKKILSRIFGIIKTKKKIST